MAKNTVTTKHKINYSDLENCKMIQQLASVVSKSKNHKELNLVMHDGDTFFEVLYNGVMVKSAWELRDAIDAYNIIDETQ